MKVLFPLFFMLYFLLFFTSCKKTEVKNNDNIFPDKIINSGKILYRARETPTGTQEQIYTIDTNGNNITQITSLNQRIESVHWGENQEIIYFSLLEDTMIFRPYQNVYSPYAKSRILCSINPDGSGFRQILKVDKTIRNMQVSPDGEKILYDSVASNPKIMDIYGLNQRELFPTHSLNTRYVQWSSDGGKIIFEGTEHSPSAQSKIYLINADGSGLRRLTNASTPESRPSISPNGQEVLYFGQATPSETASLLIVDLYGNVKSKLPYTPHFRTTWSPNGNSIAFTSLDAYTYNLEIYTVDTTNTNLKQITTNQIFEYDLDW